ncbi:MAG: hypothetical protein KJ950_12460 [Proteobacteria bacterium]|nr:hypothetical protein [Pseudomonadota bacterium]MBU1687582.1 hypothetical protein [Pseudomonadota bacterium]
MSGIFLDSPVEGLQYETPTIQGTTDSQGHFSYHEGEVIHFHVGDIDLGQTNGQEIITPMHLADGVMDQNNPTAGNMLVFLQTLDADGDPTNGILITPGMQQDAMGVHLDFSQDQNQFTTDANWIEYMDSLKQNGIFSNHMTHTPISTEQAWSHMQTTMQQYGLSYPDSTGQGDQTMHGDSSGMGQGQALGPM